jgi:hypothetical protein
MEIALVPADGALAPLYTREMERERPCRILAAMLIDRLLPASLE